MDPEAEITVEYNRIGEIVGVSNHADFSRECPYRDTAQTLAKALLFVLEQDEAERLNEREES